MVASHVACALIFRIALLCENEIIKLLFCFHLVYDFVVVSPKSRFEWTKEKTLHIEHPHINSLGSTWSYVARWYGFKPEGTCFTAFIVFDFPPFVSSGSNWLRWMQRIRVGLWRSLRVVFFRFGWTIDAFFHSAAPFSLSLWFRQCHRLLLFFSIHFIFVFHYFDLYELLDYYRYDAAIFPYDEQFSISKYK